MPKLPIVSPHKVIKALEKNGFVIIRRKGSHTQLKKDNLLVTVPIHSGDLKKETFKSILRQSGLSLEEFIGLL